MENDHLDARLALAISQAVNACDELAQGNMLSERTLTGALLGSLKTSLAIHATQDFQLGWSIYNEGPEHNDYSEAATGVDFGLVVVLKSGLIRFAAFQAKRPNDVGRTQIRANQTRGEHPNQISQLITLRDASTQLMNNAKDRNNTTLKDLRWVHYLAYSNPITCVQLARMQKQVDAESTVPGSSSSFDAIDIGIEFSAVIMSAVFARSKYWLNIGSLRGFSQLPPFFSQMPIALIAGRPLGMAPGAFLRSLLTFSPKPASKLKPSLS